MSTTTQTARIRALLSDGEWHTTAEIHRKCGSSRLNSRISSMRKPGGMDIKSQRIPNREGARAWKYRWVNHPPVPTPLSPPVENEPEVPRDVAHRYRVYCVPRYGDQTLIAAVATPEEVGVLLCERGQEGQFQGCCVGVLDTHGVEKDVKPGQWLLNPHEARW